MNTDKNTAKLAKLAMMTAVSLVLLFIVRLPWPPAPFLVYDPADVPIYITAFAFGPVEGLIVTLVVCLIQAFGLGGDGLYGFVMHFVATGIIGTMYRNSKTRKRAIISLVVGVIAAVVIMSIMNIIVTPIYMGAPREAVIAMLPTVIIPFNLVKAGANSLLTLVLYKRISGFLHGTGRTVKADERDKIQKVTTE